MLSIKGNTIQFQLYIQFPNKARNNFETQNQYYFWVWNLATTRCGQKRKKGRNRKKGNLYLYLTNKRHGQNNWKVLFYLHFRVSHIRLSKISKYNLKHNCFNIYIKGCLQRFSCTVFARVEVSSKQNN